MSAILEKVQEINDLPSLPMVIQKAGTLINDPDSSVVDIAKILQDDPAICANLLKMVNSSFYSGAYGTEITSIQTAISRIGLETTHNLALMSSLFSMFDGDSSRSFDREKFWQHSIACGIVSKVVFEFCRDHFEDYFPQDVLHMAGLMHDLGKIILEEHFSSEFHELLDASISENLPLFVLEHRRWNTNHAHVGYELGKRWGLSDQLLDVICWHHDPLKASEENRYLVAIVHVANYICNTKKIGHSGNNKPLLLVDVWKFLKLDMSIIPQIMDQVEEELDNSEMFFSLAKS